MKKKIKISILGCGKIFNKHNYALNNLQNKYEIVSICDSKIRKLSRYKFNKKILLFNSIEKFCRESKADLVIVLTPSGFHFEHIIKLSKYFKNIVVEKPVVMNAMQAKKIKEICKKKKLKLFIVKQNRFNPIIQKLKKAIDEKRFGKIFLATMRLRWSRNDNYFLQDKWRGSWKYDGGVLANQASHHIDLLLWLIGDIISVYTKGLKINKKTKSLDTCLAILKFKNGALGSIEATTATSPKDLEGSISILGEKGTVVVGGFAASKLLTWNFKIKKKIDEKIYSNKLYQKEVYGQGHVEFYKNIYNSLMYNKNPITTLDEGIKSIEIIDKLYASSELKKEVFTNDKNFSKKLGK